MYTTDHSVTPTTTAAADARNDTEALPKRYVANRPVHARPILSLARRTGFPVRTLQLSWIGLVRR